MAIRSSAFRKAATGHHVIWSISLSVCLPVTWLDSQSTVNQSVNLSVYHTTKQYVRQSSIQTVCQSFSELLSHLCKSFSQSVNCSVNQLISLSVHQPASHYVRQSFSQFVRSSVSHHIKRIKCSFSNSGFQLCNSLRRRLGLTLGTSASRNLFTVANSHNIINPVDKTKLFCVL